MYKIEKENLEASGKSPESQDLILPQKRQDRPTSWNQTRDGKISKDAFFPQSETLYTCVRDGKKLTVEPEELRSRPFVVFGMKACDVKGVAVLDKVFLADPVDTFMQQEEIMEPSLPWLVMSRRNPVSVRFWKRRSGSRSMYCRCMTWMVEGTLYWKALQKKVEALTEAVKELLTDADLDQAKVDAEKEAIHNIVEKLPYTHLSLEGWDGNATDAKFNSPVWETLYKPCLACGTCTFVCPTCQCYDIKDYDTGHGVKRYRCWDSCMYSDNDNDGSRK